MAFIIFEIGQKKGKGLGSDNGVRVARRALFHVVVVAVVLDW